MICSKKYHPLLDDECFIPHLMMSDTFLTDPIFSAILAQCLLLTCWGDTKTAPKKILLTKMLTNTR